MLQGSSLSSPRAMVECPCCKGMTDCETIDKYRSERIVYGLSLEQLASVIQYANKMGFEIGK